MDDAESLGQEDFSSDIGVIAHKRWWESEIVLCGPFGDKTVFFGFVFLLFEHGHYIGYE